MLKPITLTTTDHFALKSLLSRALSSNPKNRELWQRLHDELERAVVLPDQIIPDNVVRLGSTFTVRDLSNDECDTYTLVWPDKANIELGHLSVLAPLGTAVIGFANNDEITWTMPGGPRRLRLEAVSFSRDAQ